SAGSGSARTNCTLGSRKIFCAALEMTRWMIVSLSERQGEAVDFAKPIRVHTSHKGGQDDKCRHEPAKPTHITPSLPVLKPETSLSAFAPRPSALVTRHSLSSNPHRLVEISEGLQHNTLHPGAFQLR